MPDVAVDTPGTGPTNEMDAAVAALLASEANADEDNGNGDTQDGGDKPGTTPDANPVRKYKVKVDGEESEVDEEELVRGYSYQAHNTRAAQKNAETARALESRDKEVTAKLEQLNRILPQLEQLADADLAQFADVDWDALKRDDPSQFASLRAEYDLAREKVDVVRRKREETHAELNGRRQQEFESYARQEYESLIAARPEWKDEAVMKRDMERITAYATSAGYRPEEIANIYDHRAYIAFDKAARYDEIMARVDEARGKPRKVRTAAPSGRTTTATGSEAARAALAKARKTGSREDAVLALLAREAGK